MKKHGLEPVSKGKHANRGGLPEDRLRELAANGATIREMGEALERHPSTIRYWLKRYGIESRGMGLRRPELQEAREAGRRRVWSTCIHHGKVVYVLEGRGYYRCTKCRQAAVSEWRRRTKRKLVAAAGGACARCGYDEFQGALQFHHLVPGEKSFGISRGVNRSFAELEAEADKCILLCANCHAEIEDGYDSSRN